MKGLLIKNERQKISISVEKKDAVTEEKLEGVIFGLYAKEDILSQQGEVLVEKDTLLEKKATDEKGQLTFDSDLYHGKYYVKEEVRKPGYLPNEEIWEIDASYTDQNLAEIKLTKEVENQPTESQFTKTDATTGEELEGAKLQIIDQDGNIVEEWISTKEPHVVYGLPEGTYTLHEEMPPYAEGYVSAEDIEFEVKEDGSVTKVKMKDTYSKVEISKTDLTTGKELEGAKLQILNKDGEVLEEWVTDGKTHLVEKLPVGEELILREITAPEGYLLDTTQYDVELAYEGQDQAEVSCSLTVAEQVKKQAFQMIKVSEDGEQTETDLVAGAGFKVYLVSNLSRVKSGELKPADGNAFTAADFRDYDFSGENVAVTYENISWQKK